MGLLLSVSKAGGGAEGDFKVQIETLTHSEVGREPGLFAQHIS
jgi:hypothetical protein